MKAASTWRRLRCQSRRTRRGQTRQACAAGVSIAKKAGVACARLRQKIRLIREGDNPWLEVTIIEAATARCENVRRSGPPREKIRRVQYGPLALDVPREIAQPYSAGSSQLKPQRRDGTLPRRKPTDTAARTESYNHQAAAHTEAGKFIAPIEVPAAPRAPGPSHRSRASRPGTFQTVAHAEAQARLALCLRNHRNRAAPYKPASLPAARG